MCRKAQGYMGYNCQSVTASKGAFVAKKFNKIYIQQDAIAKHEDFDVWYEDGDVFLHFESKEGWKREKDKVQIIGRMGGQVGLIKPDNRVLNYFIRYERFEYIMHPIVIERHYFIEGMVWDMYGCAHKPPVNIVEETLTSFEHKAVHIKLVNFKDKGMCYEVHCHELEKLRIAVASFVAILIKEEWKGLSEGNDYAPPGLLNNLKHRVFENKGFTYEQVQELIAEDSPYVRIVKPQGRPIDHKDSKLKKDKRGRILQKEKEK